MDTNRKPARKRSLLNSLGGQMVLFVSSIILTGMITNAYFQFRDEVGTMEQVLKVRAQSLGQMLSSISLDALLVYDVISLNHYIEHLSQQAQVVHAVILDPQGNALTTYMDRNDPYVQSVLDSGVRVDAASLVKELNKNDTLVSFKVPVMFNDVVLAQTVVVLDNSQYVAASAAKFEEKVFVTLFIGLFVGIGMYFIFSRKVLRPIRKLSEGADRIANLEFEPVIDIGGNTELSDLSESFNQMSRNIETLIADRDSALKDLEELNIGLEHRVQERTLELQALNIEIAHQAMHDPLTDLPNRTLLVERLKQNLELATRNDRKVAFIMLDLNNFKDVNDTLGHPEGDRLLQKVAKRLPSALRASDTVGRLGGDEFGIVLPDTDCEHALEVAGKVIASFEPSFTLGQQNLSVGASVGIAVYPEHGDDDASLIRHADVAMYEAKRNRGEPCLYDPELDHYTTTRLALMADLSDALKNDLVCLYYQPQVDLQTGKVLSVEALLRWNHPVYGSISPDYFITMAESSDLIQVICDWVLEKAIAQLASWQAAGLDISVAINLSARDLANPNLPVTITRLCEQHGVSPAMLKVEITENVIMSYPEQVIDVIDHPVLSMMNYAIDDFGTGYSSLSYLKKLPIREVKIDKSFVIDMAHDADDASIVRSVIELAHNLGHVVVAEGVESKTVLNQLLELGCDIAQGYYYSPAVEAKALPAQIQRIEHSETAPFAALGKR